MAGPGGHASVAEPGAHASDEEEEEEEVDSRETPMSVAEASAKEFEVNSMETVIGVDHASQPELPQVFSALQSNLVAIQQVATRTLRRQHSNHGAAKPVSDDTASTPARSDESSMSHATARAAACEDCRWHVFEAQKLAKMMTSADM
eukprot:4912846-Karenia_brevis.AAC.1